MSLLVIMGSGETAPTMVKAHRAVLARSDVPEAGPAVMLDTTFGFQMNAEDLVTMTQALFDQRVADGMSPTEAAHDVARSFVPLQQKIDDVAPTQQGCGRPKSAQLSMHERHTTGDLQNLAVVHDEIGLPLAVKSTTHPLIGRLPCALGNDGCVTIDPLGAQGQQHVIIQRLGQFIELDGLSEHAHRVMTHNAGQPLVQRAKGLVAQAEFRRRVECAEKEINQIMKARLAAEVAVLCLQHGDLEGLQLRLHRRNVGGRGLRRPRRPAQAGLKDMAQARAPS